MIKHTRIVFLSSFMLVSCLTFAGNKDRIGQSGVSQLKINPWAQSSGMANAGEASAIGLEAVNLNVAGLAFVNKTDIRFSRTSWLTGSEININAFGIGQKVGESSVLGISIMSMSFGDIQITTVDLPEGGLGNFSPQYLNLGLSYAKSFSNSIFGGITLRSISESMSNVSARGASIDAGIRYITGENNRIKFGIALKNVGPKLKYAGDGLSTKVILRDEELTLQQRAEGFDLPALLSIGASYDIYINTSSDSLGVADVSDIDHKVTVAGSFVSNAFGKDQFILGAEYSFRSFLQARVGYAYEKGSVGSVDTKDLTSAFTGPSAGASFILPLGSNGNKLAIDYSYRTTISFSGTHSIGLRLNI